MSEPRAKPHIVLIEDNPGDVYLIMRALTAHHIDCVMTRFNDGEDALTALRPKEGSSMLRPDLILLDLNLPKYDGRQLLEKVKSDPDLARIPVVVLTTSSAEEDILRSYELHANAYVTKPVDLDQFINAVRQIDEFFIQVVRLPGL